MLNGNERLHQEKRLVLLEREGRDRLVLPSGHWRTAYLKKKKQQQQQQQL